MDNLDNHSSTNDTVSCCAFASLEKKTDLQLMKGQMVDEMSQLDDPINERWDRIIFVFAQVRKKILFLLKRILSVSMFATILRTL